MPINEWLFIANDKEIILEFASEQNLPEWAPPRLVEAFGSSFWLADDVFREKTQWRLKTLCQNQEMESAWRLMRRSFGDLVKNDSEYKKCLRWNSFLMNLYKQIELATEIRDHSTLEERKYRVNTKKNTVVSLVKMVENLKGTYIKIDIPTFLTSSGILNRSTNLEPKTIIEETHGFCAEEPFSSMFDILRNTNCAAIPISEVEDGIEKLFRFFPCGEVFLDTLLNALAEHIEKLELYDPQNKPGHQHRFFILSIGEFLKETFGTPRYSILTAIARAFYPSADLNKERVVSILRAS